MCTCMHIHSCTHRHKHTYCTTRLLFACPYSQITRRFQGWRLGHQGNERMGIDPSTRTNKSHRRTIHQWLGGRHGSIALLSSNLAHVPTVCLVHLKSTSGARKPLVPMSKQKVLMGKPEYTGHRTCSRSLETRPMPYKCMGKRHCQTNSANVTLYLASVCLQLLFRDDRSHTFYRRVCNAQRVSDQNHLAFLAVSTQKSSMA